MRKYKVLIVDDVDITSRIYNKFLDNRPEISEVIFVKDVFDAWARLITDRNIAILFIDIDLGAVSGAILLEKILEQDFRSQLYIVMSSMDEVASDMLVAKGADHSMPKPISKEGIESVLEMARNELDPSHRFYKGNCS